MPTGVLLGLILVMAAMGVAMAADRKAKVHRDTDIVPPSAAARTRSRDVAPLPSQPDGGATITARSIGTAALVIAMLGLTLGSAFVLSIGEAFAADQCDTRCDRIGPAVLSNFFGQLALVLACGLVAWLVPRLRPHVLWLTITASVVLSVVTASVAQSAIA